MTIRRAQRVKNWIVFNFPYILKHYLLQLAVKHVTALLIRFNLTYRIAV